MRGTEFKFQLHLGHLLKKEIRKHRWAVSAFLFRQLLNAASVRSPRINGWEEVPSLTSSCLPTRLSRAVSGCHVLLQSTGGGGGALSCILLRLALSSFPFLFSSINLWVPTRFPHRAPAQCPQALAGSPASSGCHLLGGKQGQVYLPAPGFRDQSLPPPTPVLSDFSVPSSLTGGKKAIRLRWF